MSDILIKDMEMPESCARCRCVRGCPAINDRIVRMDEHPWFPRDHRHEDCPLFPVPPHGRLGDLDELFEQVTMDEHFSVLEAMYIQSLISDAPTIIPAEEGE